MSLEAETTTKVPRLYRCIVPLTIRDAKRFLETEETAFPGARAQVDFSLPAEGASVGLSWALGAFPDPGVLNSMFFYLLVRAKAAIEIDVQYRICAQSPSGTTLVQWKWIHAGLKLAKEEWDDKCTQWVEFTELDKDRVLFDGNLHVYADILFQPTDGVPKETDLPAPLMDMNTVLTAFHDTTPGGTGPRSHSLTTTSPRSD